MDQNILLIAFVIFIVFIILLAFFLRRISVDDIFSDDKVASFSDTAFSDNRRDMLLGSPKSGLPSASAGSLGTEAASFKLNKENLNKIGKGLSFVGMILIFAPLPEALDGVGFIVAFFGYLLANATKEKAKKKTSLASRNSLVDTLRKLASQPEYQEAMKLLTADMADKSLVTDTDRHSRAIGYLESKGVSTEEANRNVRVMTNYIAQKNKK